VRQARTAARGRAPVLLRGESGVGKNHLARAIHNDSQRTDKPFMAIHCKAIPHELMISELLGSEPDGRPSKFELADGGTLMLNQIEALSFEMQFALLHVIETGHVMRLGSTRVIPVDVRIIATTSANLERLVAEGEFVPNLYYRFGVFNIQIPPLRERTEDIPALAARFLSRFGRAIGSQAGIGEEALQAICRYPWPGNVRELESTLERALHHCENEVIDVSDLSATIRKGRVLTVTSPHAQPILSVEEAEREAILQAGWVCQGRVSEMSQHLGIGRTTLWRKMKQLNISPAYFKQN
jgi:transcriptional activator for dhaKLM operon